MKVTHRKIMMASLVLAFVGQSTLVYTDATADAHPRLEATALRGRQLWLDNNCQACHQIYGFGGFLGPDLTNAAARIDRKRLETMLTVGSGQMPAWHFSKDQIDAIEAFLRAIDRTGIGQARSTVPIPRDQVMAAIEQEAAKDPMSPQAVVGQHLFHATCAACHCLFTSTPLGPYLAPDLSGLKNRMSDAEILQVIANGRPARGMPAWPLPEEHRTALLAYLGWLARHRDAVLAGWRASSADTHEGLPWFEFR
ncbi:MAG TPA: cytochrome c [Planctomycetota bacterium]